MLLFCPAAVPLFVPTASFRGSSLAALTVGWSKPSKKLLEFVSYYILTLTDVKTGEIKKVEQTVPESSYRFQHLNPGTFYNFSVSLPSFIPPTLPLTFITNGNKCES